MQAPEPSIARDMQAPVPAEFDTDFGNLFRRTPALLLQPRDAAEVQEAVSFANQQGRRIVCRGQGCSSFGQSLSDDLLLDTRRLNHIELLSNERVRVQAGCTIGQLQSYLVSHGLTCPVVVSNDHATLGGVLSVGGFGPTSIQAGALAQHVAGIEAISGSGEWVRAAAGDAHAQLLDYSLCGLGQVSILVSADLRVQKYKPWTAIEIRRYPADTELYDLALYLCREADWEHCRFLFLNRTQQWKVELGTAYQEPPERPGDAFEVIRDIHREVFAREAHFAPSIVSSQVSSGLLREPQQSRRIWSDFFLPASRAGEFFLMAREYFRDERIVAGFNGTLLMPGQPGWPQPLPLLPVPTADPVLSFGIYSFPPPGLAQDYLKRFEAASELCHTLGGRQYLHGYYRPGVEFFRRQFGPEIVDQWLAVKHRYDPGDILGAELF